MTRGKRSSAEINMGLDGPKESELDHLVKKIMEAKREDAIREEAMEIIPAKMESDIDKIKQWINIRAKFGSILSSTRKVDTSVIIILATSIK